MLDIHFLKGYSLRKSCYISNYASKLRLVSSIIFVIVFMLSLISEIIRYYESDEVKDSIDEDICLQCIFLSQNHLSALFSNA